MLLLVTLPVELGMIMTVKSLNISGMDVVPAGPHCCGYEWMGTDPVCGYKAAVMWEYGAAFCTHGLFNYSMWWEKRTRGAVHRPHRLSVSLTRKPHHALFIMCTHIRYLSPAYTHTQFACV